MITEIFQGQQMFSSGLWHITDREIQSPLSFPLDIWVSEEEGATDEAFCLLSSHRQTSKIRALLQRQTIRTYMICTHLHLFSLIFFSVETANYHDKKTQRERHIKVSVATTKRCSTLRLRPGLFHRKQRFLSSVQFTKTRSV